MPFTLGKRNNHGDFRPTVGQSKQYWYSNQYSDWKAEFFMANLSKHLYARATLSAVITEFLYATTYSLYPARPALRIQLHLGFAHRYFETVSPN